MRLLCALLLPPAVAHCCCCLPLPLAVPHCYCLPLLLTNAAASRARPLVEQQAAAGGRVLLVSLRDANRRGAGLRCHVLRPARPLANFGRCKRCLRSSACVACAVEDYAYARSPHVRSVSPYGTFACARGGSARRRLVFAPRARCTMTALFRADVRMALATRGGCTFTGSHD